MEGRMATEATLSHRAEIAAQVSMYIDHPDHAADAVASFEVDSTGEYTIIPAGADESAILTFHRMERTGERYVILATMLEENVTTMWMWMIERNQESVSDTSELFDVVGGMTVRDLTDALNLGAAGGFVMSGSEFTKDFSSIFRADALLTT